MHLMVFRNSTLALNNRTRVAFATWELSYHLQLQVSTEDKKLFKNETISTWFFKWPKDTFNSDILMSNIKSNFGERIILRVGDGAQSFSSLF